MNNFEQGEGCVIEPSVIIKGNVSIGHHVILKTGTWIGENAILADGVITTGPCIIGSHVNIRTGAIISKGMVIEDWSFIGPGVVTNHTKHVNWGRPNVLDEYLITVIEYKAIVGSQSTLLAGVRIGFESIVGAGALVTEDIPSRTLAFGVPARSRHPVPLENIDGEVPRNAGKMYTGLIRARIPSGRIPPFA